MGWDGMRIIIFMQIFSMKGKGEGGMCDKVVLFYIILNLLYIFVF